MISGIWNQVSSKIGMSASPLSEAGESSVNSATTTSIPQHFSENFEVTSYTTQTLDSDSEGPPSSPFVANVSESIEDRENTSPNQAARMAAKSPEREPISSLKPLKSHASPTSKSRSPQKISESMGSPRKLSSP